MTVKILSTVTWYASTVLSMTDSVLTYLAMEAQLDFLEYSLTNKSIQCCIPMQGGGAV